jgi:L-fucose dehydrogenase
MNLNLTDKVVVVTGGTGGIGEAIALHFALEGAIPIIVGRDESRGKQVLQELQKHHSEAYLILAELSQPDACKHTVDTIRARFGRIDVLVNNAGGNDLVGLDAGPQAFMKSLERNLLHYYTIVHYSLDMLKASKGNIINIGSKVAQTGQGKTSGYAASKGAVQALTREWALDLKDDGIRVNEVVPAEVMTLSYMNWLQRFEDKEERIRQITRHIPLGNRFTTADEIADMVVFLASDRASHITGQHIFVDGGYTHLDRAIDF